MAGEVADLVILGNAGTEELVKQGKLVGNALKVFAKSGIYVAVRSGAPNPDISSVDALKSSVLTARSVAYSEGASGTYLVGMFQRLGIYDQVKLKASIAKANEPVGDKLVRGDADIGFHQLSELIPVKGIQIIGPLPAEVQHITVFSGAIHREAKEPKAGEALVEFLTTPAVGQRIRKHGLDSAQ
jgi:molybdate transport system substrate-binding protein